MAEIKVAKRYAKSLLDLAQEQGVVESVIKDIRLIHDTCEQNRDLVLLLKNPIVNSDKKFNILREMFINKVNKLTLAFLDIIIRKRREMYLDLITKEFISAYKRNKGIETAVITSAIGLDEKLRKEVVSLVKNSTKSEVELIEKIDRNLIGGFLLRIGDMQYDTSIVRSLRKLSREFNSNPYVRKN